jgi:hypothetical protein
MRGIRCATQTHTHRCCKRYPHAPTRRSVGCRTRSHRRRRGLYATSACCAADALLVEESRLSLAQAVAFGWGKIFSQNNSSGSARLFCFVFGFRDRLLQ